MRIALDAHNLWTAGGLSIGHNVVAALPRVAPMHQYLVVCPRGVGYPSYEGFDNVRVVETRSATSMAWRAAEGLLQVPAALKAFAPDIVLALGNQPVRWKRGYQAVLVHDAHLFYPRSYHPRDRWRDRLRQRLQSVYLRWGMRYVDLFFCQTRTAAHRFRGMYGFPSVAVMPNAVSWSLRSGGETTSMPPPIAAHAGKFKLIALTRYYPHKNLELIVDAFDRHPRLMADTVCFLTIDANHHPGARSLLRRLAAGPQQVVNLGPIQQSEIGAYWGAVDALIHPSTLESFSSAYLEAMAFGVPILTSDLDFAHEVCASSARYFDPAEPLALANAVAALRDDRALQLELIESGRAQFESMIVEWEDVIRGALDVMGIDHE